MTDRIEAVRECFEPPDRVYIHGHWTAGDSRAEEALEVARAEFVELSRLHGHERAAPRVSFGGRLWGHLLRLVRGGTKLKISGSPGQDSFPLTEVLDQDYIDRRRRELEECDQIRKQLEAMLSAKFPEASRVRAHCDAPGLARASVYLPGPGYFGYREERPGVAIIPPGSLEAWNRLYAGRGFEGVEAKKLAGGDE